MPESPAPGIAGFLRTLPERPRWEVSRCRSRDAALGQLAARGFDAVLVDDHGLQRDECLALLRTIRTNHPTIAMLVLCARERLSAYDSLYDIGVFRPLTHCDLTPQRFFDAVHHSMRCQQQANMRAKEHGELQRRFDEQAGYLRSLVNEARDGIVIVDQKGIIRFVNPPATRLFGRSAAKLVGACFGYPLAGGRGIAIDVPRGGAALAVEMRVSTIAWENRVAFLAALRDVSDDAAPADPLRLAEAAEQRAAQLRSDFLATMSHEIRTPLNGLLGMARLMHETPLSDAQNGLIGSIQSSGESLLALVNDLLDLARTEAGALAFEQRRFNLPEVVRETLSLHAPLANAKGLLLASELTGDVPDEVVGDKVRFRQLLGKLVSNALKYTAEGTVQLRLAATPRAAEGGCRLHIEVRDTGAGLPPAACAGLFQPFKQLGRHAHVSGADPALALCKHLVSRMGGDLAVESTAGAGTVCRLRLPFRDPSYAASLFNSAAAYNRRVLIISEKRANLAVYAQLFATAGFAPAPLLLAELPDSPLGRAAVWPHDLVLADLQGATLTAGWENALRMARARQLPLIRMQALAADSTPGPKEAILPTPVHHVALIETAKVLLADPLSATRRRVATGEAKPGPPPQCRRDYPLKILIAEDNGVNQQVAQRFLRLLGFASDCVGDGQEAVQAALARPYGLILMDCHMPEMNGLQASRLIRAMEDRGRHTPIVALTANAMQEDMRACQRAGMNGFLAKPLRLEEMAKELLRLIPEAFASAAEPAMAVTAAAAAPATAAELGPSAAGEGAAAVPGYADVAAFRALGEADATSGVDEEFLREILGSYEECCPPRLAALRDAIAARNAENVRFLAHSLKGSSANLGAVGVAAACAALERLAQDGGALGPEAHALLARITTAYEEGLKELRSAITSAPN